MSNQIDTKQAVASTIEQFVNGIVDSRQFQFDRTILGEIYSATLNDSGTWNYKIYSAIIGTMFSINNVEKEYSKGESVYVLIPSNDFNLDKQIIGRAGGSEIKPVELQNLKDQYLQITDPISLKVPAETENIAENPIKNINYNFPQKYKYVAIKTVFQHRQDTTNTNTTTTDDFAKKNAPYFFTISLKDKYGVVLPITISSNEMFGNIYWEEPMELFSLFEVNNNFILENVESVSVTPIQSIAYSQKEEKIVETIKNNTEIIFKELSMSFGNLQTDYSSETIAIYQVGKDEKGNEIIKDSLEQLSFADFSKQTYKIDNEQPSKEYFNKLHARLIVKNEKGKFICRDAALEDNIKWFRYRVGSYNVGAGTYWANVTHIYKNEGAEVIEQLIANTFPLNKEQPYKAVLQLGDPITTETFYFCNEKMQYENIKATYTPSSERSGAIVSNIMSYDDGYKSGYIEIINKAETYSYSYDNKDGYTPNLIDLEAKVFGTTEEQFSWYVNGIQIYINENKININADGTPYTGQMLQPDAKTLFDQYSEITIECKSKNDPINIVGDSIKLIKYASGKDFTVTTDTYTLKTQGTNEYANTATLTAHLQNLTGSVKWFKGNEETPIKDKKDSKTDYIGNTYTAEEPGTYKAVLYQGDTKTGWEDSITIISISDGVDAISIALTNPTMNFDKQGKETFENCNVMVFQGAKQFDYGEVKAGEQLKNCYTIIGLGSLVDDTGTIIIYKPEVSTTISFTVEVYDENGAKITSEYFTIFCNVIGDGKGITQVINYYVITKNTSLNGNEDWDTTPQPPTKDEPYLWNYEATTYSDGEVVNTDPAIIGVFQEGQDGKGISSIEEFYLISDETSCSTSLDDVNDQGNNPYIWYKTPPLTTSTYKYLWNRERITYTTEEIVITDPAIIGVHGEKGDKGDSIYRLVFVGNSDIKISTDAQGNPKNTLSSSIELSTELWYENNNIIDYKLVIGKWKEINENHSFISNIQVINNNEIKISLQEKPTISSVISIPVSAMIKKQPTDETYDQIVDLEYIYITPVPQGKDGDKGDPGQDGNALELILEETLNGETKNYNGKYTFYGFDNRAVSDSMLRCDKKLTPSFRNGLNNQKVNTAIWEIPIDATMIKPRLSDNEWVANDNYYTRTIEASGSNSSLALNECAILFDIKNIYLPTANNNKITCTLQERSYEGNSYTIINQWKGEYTPFFASGGNQGTSYSFSINFKEGYPIALNRTTVDEEDFLDKEKFTIVEAHLYDSEGKDIIDSMVNNITWTLELQNALQKNIYIVKKGQEYIPEDIEKTEDRKQLPVAIQNVATNLALNEILLYFDNDYEGNLHGNIIRASMNFAVDLTSQDKDTVYTSEVLNDNEQTINYTSRLAIGVKRNTDYTYIQAPTYISYDSLGKELSQSNESLKVLNAENINVATSWGFSGTRSDMVIKKEERDPPIFSLVPTSIYDSGSENAELLAYDSNGDTIWSQPIVISRNAYEFDILNQWGGEVQINDSDGMGYILAPLLGAGRKGEDNKFSGVVMGTIGKFTNNSNYSETGLYGFKNGTATYGFRENGSFFFGDSVNNKIEFDTKSGTFSIRTNSIAIKTTNSSLNTNFLLNTDNTYNEALLMQLTKGGNPVFELYKSGEAKIAGWNIDYGKLSSSNGDYTTTIRSQKSSIGAGEYAFSVYSETAKDFPFFVGFDGKLTARGAIIEGNITADIFSLTSTKVILDNNGITINGGNFDVKNSSGTSGLYFNSSDQELYLNGSLVSTSGSKLYFDNSPNITYGDGLFVHDAQDSEWLKFWPGYSEGVFDITNISGKNGIAITDINDNDIIAKFSPKDDIYLNINTHYTSLEGNQLFGNTVYSNTIIVDNVLNIRDVDAQLWRNSDNDLVISSSYKVALSYNNSSKLETNSAGGHLYGTWTPSNWSSDIRLKHSIENLQDNYEILFDTLQPKRYKYNNGTSNRYHTGFIAQEVLEAVNNSGLTTQDFAAMYLTEREDSGLDEPVWVLRRDEFVALNTWQIQKLKARVTELEQEIKELKQNEI